MEKMAPRRRDTGMMYVSMYGIVYKVVERDVMELGVVIDEVVDLLEHVHRDVDDREREDAEEKNAHELLEEVSVVYADSHHLAPG